MKMCNTMLTTVLVLTFGTQIWASQQHSSRIEPTLEPVSSKKFMKKDYPHDDRAIADKNYVFDHPYPAVQDSGDFDRDFVNDENSDGGKWDAQMTYDSLRSKIRREAKKMDELKKVMEKEYKDWQNAKEAVGQSGDALKDAQKKAGEAGGAAGDAAKRVNELEGASGKDGTRVGGEVGKAVGDVEKDMKALEDCKKQLAETKRKLKELLKQREAEAKAQKEKTDKDKIVKTEGKNQTDSHKVDKNGTAGKSESEKKGGKGSGDDGDAHNSAAAWRARLKKDQEKVAETSKAYDEEVAELRRAEKELEEAAKNLKRFRRSPYVDDDGGVYNVPSDKSMASTKSAPAVFLMTLVFMLAVPLR